MKVLIPVVIIIVCCLTYFFYISPILTEIGSLREEKAEYADVLSTSEELKVKRDAVQMAYDSIPQADVAKLNKIIPDKFNAILFANDINIMASRYGLTLNTFNVDMPVEGPRDVVVTGQKELYKTSTITLVVDGSFSQFLRFLSDIETSLQIMDVKNFSISQSQSQKIGESALSYSMELTTYSMR